MCVLLCEYSIACALRKRVVLVGIVLTRHCSPRHETPFQVHVMYRRLTLIWDRRCEESRTVALRNLFVEKKNRSRTLMNCFDKFVYSSTIYMHEWIPVNGTRYGGIEICDTHRYFVR